MNPIIRRLHENYSELPLLHEGQTLLSFKKKLKKLGPDFYQKIIPQHLVLNLEYSLLGQQLREQFLSKKQLNQKEIEDQLMAAIMLTELLKQIYKYYLLVPNEVSRFRKQQNLYCSILKEIKSLPKNLKPTHSFSLTQYIRQTTVEVNLYRLLFVRSKRTLELIAALETVSESYRSCIKIMDKYVSPIIAYIAWIFFIPRLSVNLFLLIKHAVPFGKGKEEQSLGWKVRTQAQLQRRWFELANDLVWFIVGLTNCFLFIGALAPIAGFLSLACFAYDVVLSALRAYIELGRLYELQKQYKAMQNTMCSEEEQREIEDHLAAIDNQINFEMLRLGSHLATTTAIFLAMCCIAPFFAAFPIIPVIGGVVLVLVCLINISLAQLVQESRPKDTFDLPKEGVSQLGFFAKKESDIKPEYPLELDHPELLLC